MSSHETTHDRTLVVLAMDVCNLTLSRGPRCSAVERRLEADFSHFRDIIEREEGCLLSDHGRGVLAVFSSAVKALACASMMQDFVYSRNARLPKDDQSLAYRIGLDAGEIGIHDGVATGDAVEIAVRLEALCSPGQIAFSQAIHSLTEDRVDLDRSQPGTELGFKGKRIGVWIGKVLLDPRRTKPRHKLLTYYVPASDGGLTLNFKGACVVAVLSALFTIGAYKSWTWVGDYTKASEVRVAAEETEAQRRLAVFTASHVLPVGKSLNLGSKKGGHNLKATPGSPDESEDEPEIDPETEPIEPVLDPPVEQPTATPPPVIEPTQDIAVINPTH